MKRYVILGLLVVCSGLAAAAIEFDNSENVTSQDWDFYNLSAGGNISPEDGWQNPNAQATAVLHYGPTGGHRSWSIDGDHRGVMFDRENLGISLEIPNYDIDNPYKEIYVEIVYSGVISDASVTWQGVAGLEIKTEADEYEIVPLADGWIMYSALWTIQPNPTVETIQYSFVPGGQAEARLDYILVQTSCIPEPATLLLFGLGGLVLRKKKHG